MESTNSVVLKKYVRFRCIESPNAENLIPFIQENVSQGSTIITDGWNGYKPFRFIIHLM